MENLLQNISEELIKFSLYHKKLSISCYKLVWKYPSTHIYKFTLEFVYPRNLWHSIFSLGTQCKSSNSGIPLHFTNNSHNVQVNCLMTRSKPGIPGMIQVWFEFMSCQISSTCAHSWNPIFSLTPECNFNVRTFQIGKRLADLFIILFHLSACISIKIYLSQLYISIFQL